MGQSGKMSAVEAGGPEFRSPNTCVKSRYRCAHLIESLNLQSQPSHLYSGYLVRACLVCCYKLSAIMYLACSANSVDIKEIKRKE